MSKRPEILEEENKKLALSNQRYAEQVVHMQQEILFMQKVSQSLSGALGHLLTLHCGGKLVMSPETMADQFKNPRNHVMMDGDALGNHIFVTRGVREQEAHSVKENEEAPKEKPLIQIVKR